MHGKSGYVNPTLAYGNQYLIEYIYVGLPSVLWPFHLPLVQLLANHDLGSHTTRPRVPVLQSLQHHWQDLVFYRSHRLQCNYRRKSVGKCLDAILLLVCVECCQLFDTVLGC